MQKIRRTIRMALLLILTAITALSVSGIAAAQSSPRFDLACWGVITPGGDLRTIGGSNVRFTLADSVGQWTLGESYGSRYTVRSGYLSAFGVSGPATLFASAGEQAPDAQIYIPLMRNSFRLVYVCSY